MRRPWTLLPLIGLALLPGPLSAHEAEAWLDGAVPARALSGAVDQLVEEAARRDLGGEDLSVMGISPGAPRFEGEWAFATYAMAAVGQAQLGLLEPALRAEQAARCSRAVDALLQPGPWSFDQAAWGDQALGHLDEDTHDHAVLGYLGLALGLERLVDPDNRRAALHDRVAAALGRRLRRTPILETYPGEAYPVDHAMALASVALHARATGRPPPAWLAGELEDFEARYVDDHDLLVQVAAPRSGAPRSVGRGSGTALAAWALAWADPDLSLRLSRGLRDGLAERRMGLGVVREFHPATCAAGHPCRGDVDSGPLILGASVSATGFSLAAARRLGDRAWFTELWLTTRSFGAWDGEAFATGGPLGNAIMLAMLTAPPLGDPQAR